MSRGLKPASFFKKGSVIKCLVDGYNKERLQEMVSNLQIGDELTLFERTEKSKEEAFKSRGTPIENQPTHNLVLVTAEDVKQRRDEWLAKNPRKSHGI